MNTERFSDSGLRLHVKEVLDSDNEIRETQDLDEGDRSEDVKLSGEGQRRRDKDPMEKESSRLKRLLRNRVSAQQARERKKVYVNEMEERVKDLEAKNNGLVERLSTLQKENHMLRHIIKNTMSSSSH